MGSTGLEGFKPSYCNMCGVALDDGANFCRFCGFKLPAPAVAPGTREVRRSSASAEDTQSYRVVPVPERAPSTPPLAAPAPAPAHAPAPASSSAPRSPARRYVLVAAALVLCALFLLWALSAWGG